MNLCADEEAIDIQIGILYPIRIDRCFHPTGAAFKESEGN